LTQVHLLHVKIADIIDKNIPEDCRLVRDQACGGRQHIPLFVSPDKSFETQICNVDLLVLKDQKIRLIVEIEESNVKPTNICGKLLCSALTRYYIHESEDTPIAMDDCVTFIQVVDARKLKKDKTSKFKQWKILQSSIATVLPFQGSSIKEYRIFYHDQIGDLTSFVSELCSK